MAWSMAMIWKGREIKTFADVMWAMQGISTKGDALTFKRWYEAETPSAAANIGYLTGYFSADVMLMLLELFEVSHPVFGKRVPTPEEAYQAGLRMAKEVPKDEVTRDKVLVSRGKLK